MLSPQKIRGYTTPNSNELLTAPEFPTNRFSFRVHSHAIQYSTIVKIFTMFKWFCSQFYVEIFYNVFELIKTFYRTILKFCNTYSALRVKYVSEILKVVPVQAVAELNVDYLCNWPFSSQLANHCNKLLLGSNLKQIRIVGALVNIDIHQLRESIVEL